MPGERLMCVWVAAHSLNPDSQDKKLTKKILHRVVDQLSDLSTVRYSRNKFDDFFKTDQDVNISSFREYLFEVLSEVGALQCLLQKEVENRCWDLCKVNSSKQNLSETNVRKLWEISNRLCDIDTFPPVMSQGVVNWFLEKACGHLDTMWKTGSITEKKYTFVSLLEKLVDEFFIGETKSSVTRCIDELHKWLVCEVMKTGWLYRRSKKQANWTNWRKAWFVLTSTHLIYYENPGHALTDKRRGEVILTGSKLEILPPYKGVIHKLQGRFKLSSLPYLEVELSTQEYKLRRSWITYIEESLDAARDRTTPIQRLLKARWGGENENDGQKARLSSKLNELKMAAVIKPEVAESSSQQVPLRQEFDQISITSSITSSNPESEDESFDNAEDNMIKVSNDKMKTVFMKIDKDGNGKIDEAEFKDFIGNLGLKISDKEVQLIYKSIEKNSRSYITFQEFSCYFANVLLDETVTGEAETKLRGAFLKADRDGTGTLDFKEFAEYVWDKKRSVRMSSLLTAFGHMDERNQGQVSYDQFREFYKNRMSSVPEIEAYKNEEGLCALDEKLKEFYDESEAEDLAAFVRDRWNKFATFRRYGASGELAMTGGHGMVDDIVPGEYSLIDLALFSDLPPLIPKHNVVKGVRWQRSTSKGKSGKIIFPNDFDGKLLLDTATPEHLRYYGCSFAEGNQLKISLLYRHGIQDFTYENKYLEDYVTAANGGSGIERHEFSHLDCPLEEDSGNFILAKLVGEDELHLTAFQVPVRHTLYIPGGVIHSNDHLKGTWRTMLSDEADIDHVHLVKGTPPKDLTHFRFVFQ